MKKILFVINTLGRAGAETALLELLNHLDTEKYEISLYVLLGQGEMISRVPPEVHIKNKRICEDSVLSGAGRRKLLQTSVMALFRHGHTMEKIRYLMKNLRVMKKAGKFSRINCSGESFRTGQTGWMKPLIWRLLIWKAALLITLRIT